jgi:hypothetical protein
MKGKRGASALSASVDVTPEVPHPLVAKTCRALLAADSAIDRVLSRVIDRLFEKHVDTMIKPYAKNCLKLGLTQCAVLSHCGGDKRRDKQWDIDDS